MRIAYLAQLLFPALLLADFCAAWMLGQIHPKPLSLDVACAAISAVWLAVGLAVFLLARDRKRFFERITGPLITIYMCLAMLAAAEGFLHVIPVIAPIPGELRPGRTKIGPIDPAEFPGVHGTKTFTINRLGLRGPLPPPDPSVYRIMVIGGSTAICTYLDDSEEWPHVLMSILNSGHRPPAVWVGNAAVSGRSTMHHIVLMQWLPGVIDFDMALFLVGVNDMYATLAYNGAPTEQTMEKATGYQGDLRPGVPYRRLHPYFERLSLTRVLTQGLSGLPGLLEGSGGERPADLDVLAYRRQRASGNLVPLPDLHTGLDEYRFRLMKLVALCHSTGRRCVFLTQPSIWRPGLTPEQLKLLWAGRVGSFTHPTGFIAPADLGRAMEAYNQVLLDVCHSQGLECLDLAARIPKDTTAFYDDVHYNEEGARMVARNVEGYLLAKLPFR